MTVKSKEHAANDPMIIIASEIERITDLSLAELNTTYGPAGTYVTYLQETFGVTHEVANKINSKVRGSILVRENALLEELSQSERSAIGSLSLQDLEDHYLHAGTYVQELIARGLTIEQANRINSDIRESVFTQARSLGIDVSKIA